MFNNINEEKNNEEVQAVQEGAKSTLRFINFDFSDIEASESKSNSRGSTGAPGYLSVINSLKNGKRVTISKKLLEDLKNPSGVQFAFKDGKIIVGELLSLNDSVVVHVLKKEKSDSRAIIYNYELVNEITAKCNLDFSNGKTSITFRKAEYTINDGKIVAILTLA